MGKEPQHNWLGLYHQMVRIRYCEESFVEPIISGEIRCPVHLYSGEEAIAVGVCSQLIRTDSVFGTHRSHGHFLAKGGSMKELVAEVYCRSTGCSRGRGGSMHLIDPSIGFLGAVPIVGGTISLALGAALAHSIRDDKGVAVAFFGDGAAGEGALYESINFAAVKRLPLILVCENNSYSTHMPISEIRACTEIHLSAKPFNAMAISVDGNNLNDVIEATVRAVNACRNGDGPVFLECITYRLRGHVGPDDNIQGTRTDIRPAEELAAWRTRDPILSLRKNLIDSKLCSEAELASIENCASQEVTEAHEFARKSSYPNVTEVNYNVFR